MVSLSRKAVPTYLVLVVVTVMLLSPVAMSVAAVPGGGSGDKLTAAEELTDGLSSDDVLTQSDDDVHITSELAQQASDDDVVEAYVRMDVEASAIVSSEDVTATGGQAALEQEATLTQSVFETYADSTAGVELVSEFWLDNAVLVQVESDLISELAQVDGVTELHPNYEVDLVEPEPSDVSAEIPTDAPTTYGVDQVNAPSFWETYDSAGEDTTIGIVDTGIDPDHPEFEDYDPDNWAFYDFDGSAIDSEPFDDNDHGTHVAGTAAGSNAESGDIQIGVAPEAELYAINVFPDPDGGTTLAAIVAGLQHAVDEDLDVANFSLGGAGFAAVYADLIYNAMDAGTLIVSSSGNAGPGSTGTPANVYDAIAVGATDADRQITDFSTGDVVNTPADWGYVALDHWPDEYATPDVSAPGAAVLSSVAGGQYAEFQGTSMAAPHVTGVAALLMAEFDLEPHELKDTLQDTASKPASHQISDAVIGDAAAVSEEQVNNLFDDDVRDVRYGFGIIDAVDAAFSADEDTGTLSGTVVDEEGDPVEQATVSVEGAGVQPVSTEADGAFEFELLAGEYTVSAEAFGGSAEKTVSVSAGTSVSAELELEPQVDVELLEDQPLEVAANDTFDIAVDVANLEEFTVSLADDATTDAEDVTVELAGVGELELGEPVTFEEPFSDTAVLSVSTTADAADSTLALEHTFAGLGDELVVPTSPTTVLDADAERAPVEIVDTDIEDEVFYNAPSPAGTITLENPGDFTEEVVLNHVVDIFGAGDGPFLIDIPAVLDAGETQEVELGPYNWWVIGDEAGTIVDHIVGVNDLPTLFGGAPDDETGILTTILTGAGPIEGQVTDSDTGEPVTGATVTAEAPTGATYTATTDADGMYEVVGQDFLGEYEVTVDVDGAYDAESQTVEVDEFGFPVTQDFELDSTPTYRLTIPADEPTAVGIPGPVDADTLGELILTEDVDGVMYGFDAEEGQWELATADTEVDALDAFVITAEETVYVEMTLPDDDTPQPSDADVHEGWNLLVPTMFDEPGEAFSTTAETQSIIQMHGEPTTPMTQAGGFDGVQLLSDHDDHVNPFAAYFVQVDRDGVQGSLLTNDGLSLWESNDRLQVSTDRLEGTLTGEFSEEPIEGATVTVDGTPWTAQSGPDGEVGFNYLYPGAEPTVSVEADGYADAELEVSEEMTLQEETFYQVTDLDVTAAAGTGDEIAVTYEVTNQGTEAAEKQVQVEAGPEVGEQFARLDENTFALDTRALALDAGESETVTITEEIGEFHTAGVQEIGVITDATGLGADDVATSPFSLADVGFSDQALGTDDVENGNATVIVDDVYADAGDWVAVTFTEPTAPGEVIVGVTQLEEAVMGDGVEVQIEETGAFPGEHTAHVIPELSGDTADDPIGSLVSEETVDNILAQDSATVYDADVAIDDQNVAEPTDSVMVDMADLQPDDEYVIVIHEETDGLPVLGFSEPLSGAEDEVAVALDEEISGATDVVAMLHFADEEPFGSSIPASVEGELEPVTDSALVQAGTEISLDELELDDTSASAETTYEMNYSYASAPGMPAAEFISVGFGDDSVNLSEVGAGDVSVDGPEAVGVADVIELDTQTLVIALDDGIEGALGDAYDVEIDGVVNADAPGAYDLTLGLHAADEGEPVPEPFAADADTYDLVFDQDAEIIASLSETEVGVGDNATVSLEFEGHPSDRTVAGYETTISYDPEIVEFLGAEGVDLDDPVVSVDEDAGEVSLFLAEGDDTPLTAADLEFETLDAGVVPVEFVDLQVDGPGGETYETFEINGEIASFFEQPTYEVSNLDPEEAEAEPGDTIDVSATVTNLGELAGEKDVELRLDGATVSTKGDVALEPGQSTIIQFVDVTVPEEPGDYVHSIWTEDDEATGNLTVAEANELTFNDQELDADFVSVENVSTAQNSTIAVTYEDGDNETIAGLADADMLDDATVSVEIEDDGGFPGVHTAWLFDDDDVPGDIGIGDDASPIAGDALDSDSANVTEASPETSTAAPGKFGGLAAIAGGGAA